MPSLRQVDHRLCKSKAQHAYLNKRCSSADSEIIQKRRTKNNTNPVPAPAKPLLQGQRHTFTRSKMAFTKSSLNS